MPKFQTEALPALRLIHLELESSPDETSHALHNSLPRPLARHVDIAIIRVAHKTVLAPLLFPVEFLEHEIRQQRRQRPPCGVPSSTGLCPFPITPDSRMARISLSILLSLTRRAIAAISLSWLSRSKNFSKSRSTTQRCRRRYTAAPWLPPEAPNVADEARDCVRERRVPSALQYLHHRLLDKSIQLRRNAHVICQLTPHRMPSCSSARALDPRFFQTPPRGDALALLYPSPPPGWARDFHPQAVEHSATKQRDVRVERPLCFFKVLSLNDFGDYSFLSPPSV